MPDPLDQTPATDPTLDPTATPSTTPDEVPRQSPATWGEAWRATPGPRSWPAAGVLALKGAAMGFADVIPGVSGGTICFITGIYEQFIAAVASLDGPAVGRLARLDGKGAAARVHLRFLLPLLLGVGVSIVIFSKIIPKLMATHDIEMWSFFFGLILASIIILLREVKGWSPGRGVMLLGGAVGAWLLTGLIPVQTPNDLWFIVLCGAISICAFALPGISGSFLMLILGKYLYVIQAVNDLFSVEVWRTRGLPWSQFLVLLCFAVGQVVGLVLFVRLLKWALARWHEAIMCGLIGLMLGSMRKVWPWKHAVETVLVRKPDGEGVKEKTKVLAEALRWPWDFHGDFEQHRTVLDLTLPDAQPVAETVAASAGDPHYVAATLCAVAGFATVLILEALATGKDEAGPAPALAADPTPPTPPAPPEDRGHGG